jgi:hypothetical protein
VRYDNNGRLVIKDVVLLPGAWFIIVDKRANCFMRSVDRLQHAARIPSVKRFELLSLLAGWLAD